MDRVKKHTRKVAVGIVGGLVLLVGVITIPYPGPGWLTVFAGLAILSTEFHWAKRVLKYARGKYDAWQNWLKRQNTTVRALFWCMTAVVVVVTIWLLNGYGFIADFVGIDWSWLRSPLPIPGKG